MHQAVYSILLVEDNRAVAEAFARLLLALGHQVRTAHNGFEALNMVKDQRPQIVISDLTMPGMSGFDLAQAIRQEHSADKVVLVALSGYDPEHDAAREKEAGFEYHLTKPATVADLCKLFLSIKERRGAA